MLPGAYGRCDTIQPRPSLSFFLPCTKVTEGMLRGNPRGSVKPKGEKRPGEEPRALGLPRVSCPHWALQIQAICMTDKAQAEGEGCAVSRSPRVRNGVSGFGPVDLSWFLQQLLLPSLP